MPVERPRVNDLLVWQFSKNALCSPDEIYSGLHTGETEGTHGLRYLSIWSSYKRGHLTYDNEWMPKNHEGDVSLFMIPKEYMT